jgi:hypothetical protein
MQELQKFRRSGVGSWLLKARITTTEQTPLSDRTVSRTEILVAWCQKIRFLQGGMLPPSEAATPEF